MDMVTLTVVSAFAMGAAIPLKYAGGGENISPPLSWSQVPAGTASIAILCDDPDAPVGDWVHWVLFDLPPETVKLEAGVRRQAKLSSGGTQGLNDYNRSGYDGPWPPPGKVHHYYFKVFALDTKLNLSGTARKTDLVKAIQGHILAQGQLIGTFQR